MTLSLLSLLSTGAAAAYVIQFVFELSLRYLMKPKLMFSYSAFCQFSAHDITLALFLGQFKSHIYC